MPITTGSNPMAMKPKGVKKPKKASLPKAKPSVAKPRKASPKKSLVPTTTLDKLIKGAGG